MKNLKEMTRVEMVEFYKSHGGITESSFNIPIIGNKDMLYNKLNKSKELDDMIYKEIKRRFDVMDITTSKCGSIVKEYITHLERIYTNHRYVLGAIGILELKITEAKILILTKEKPELIEKYGKGTIETLLILNTVVKKEASKIKYYISEFEEVYEISEKLHISNDIGITDLLQLKQKYEDLNKIIEYTNLI